MEKFMNAIKVIIPILVASPPLAKGIYLLTALFCIMSISTFIYYYINPPMIAKEPYPGFNQNFREVLAAERIKESGALLHVVFGSLAEIQHTTVVLPVGEEIDFNQRGSKSVLASFDNHTISGIPFYQSIESRFPKSERPIGAGLGYCKYISFNKESNNLNGAIFVVTTRNLSKDQKHYGLYHNTPVEGIDSILDKVIQEATEQKIESIAVPLLGTGYANIAVTHNNKLLKTKLEKIVALISMQKFYEALKIKNAKLKRAIIVVYSNNHYSEEEASIWRDIVKFASKSKDEQLTDIKNEIKQFQEIAEKSS